MALETGNKLNNLLSEGTPNGLYFSEWMGKKKVYVIKSARPMNWGRLRKIELVCVKPRS